MKKLLLMFAAVATLFTACTEECNHDFIEMDHSADLVGTWTCLTADYAEALVITADGSVVSTGVEDGEFWDGVKGNIKTVNNKMTLTFEDNDNYEGRFEMICGEAFTIFNENGDHLTYRYCANDLADEIVGMWVCNDGPTDTVNDMAIETFDKNGKATFTGYGAFAGNFSLNNTGTYKVIGDLLFQNTSEGNPIEGLPAYIVTKVFYAPNENALGDMMIQKRYVNEGGNTVEKVSSWLRVKQSLNLEGNKYSYNKNYVTNVKGLDQEIDFMGFKFNFAEMDGVRLDKMLKTILFEIEFPDANTIKYSCRHSIGAQNVVAPIAVEGNKMTIKMSKVYPTAKDVDLYTFQDVDGCKLHMYLPTYSFINFFGNMQVIMMAQQDQLNLDDTAAVKAVFDTIDSAVDTINVSFVMEKAAK